MGFFSNAVVGFIAGICAIAGLQYFQKKRSKHRMQRAVDLASLSRANVEDFRKLFSKDFFPSWVQFPEFERVNWLNTELKEIWPYVNKAVSTVLRETLEPILEQYRPSAIASLAFQKLTLGTIAPQFGGVKIVDSPPNEIVLEIDFKWGGNPSIVLMVHTYLGVSLPVQVRDVSFFGVFRIALTPLVDTIPCFGAMTVALSHKPSLDFSLDIVGGDLTSVPGLSGAIEGLIRTAVSDSLLWPMRIVIPIVPGDYRYLELQPVGEVEVKLVEARDLDVDLLLGKPDAFAILHVREIPSRVRKSRAKRSTLNPVWNEVFSLTVEDPSIQRLVITVMHEGEMAQSRFIGRAALQLAGCQPGALRDVWLPLVKDVDDLRGSGPGGAGGPGEKEKPRGKVHLEVVYRPREEDSERTVLEREMGIGESQGGTVATLRTPRQQKDRYRRGVLMVTVDRGVGLVAKDMGQTSDPFVVLHMQLGSARKRTKVISKSLNPVWNETFDFLVEDAGHDMLNLDVWDHNVFGKQFMGRAAVTLTKVIYDGDYQDELELRDVDAGRLWVYLKWKALV